MFAEVGLTLTDATGIGVTVTPTLDDFPSDAALTFASPGLIAVTSPLPLTDATVGSDDAHVTTRFERGVPSAPVSAADIWSVLPATRPAAPLTIGFSGGPEIATAATASGMRMAYVLSLSRSVCC